MTSDHKKALLLLHSVIFNYHGLDKEEQRILDETTRELDADQELEWVHNFVREDFPALFDRAREFFKLTVVPADKSLRVKFLNKVWDATNKKGHITEMEAMGILRLAKDWGVERDFLALIRN